MGTKSFVVSRTLVLIFVLLTGTVLCFAQFAGGDGSLANPYQIINAEQLNAMRNNLNVHYKLMVDIDLGVEPYNTGLGWLPIGTAATPFTGSLNGNNRSISNLFINRPTANYTGLFGYSSGAELSYLALLNTSVTGAHYTGTLIGCAFATEITRCSAQGSVTGANQTGGLLGSLENGGTLTESFVEGTVSGQINVGGITGYNKGNSMISKSVSYATVTGTQATGGLIGNLGSATAQNCYATGSVNGNWASGGLAGLNDAQSLISNCYSIGSVIGTTYTGGLVGRRVLGQATNSYWNTESSGQSVSAGGFGRLGSEMVYPYTTDTYQDWDFAVNWMHDTSSLQNSGYPYLAWQQLLLPPHTLIAIAGVEMVELQWQAPIGSSPLSYNVYRNGTLLGGVTELSYTDLGLSGGVSYQYYVTAVYSTGESEASNLVEAIPESSLTLPEPVTLLAPANGATDLDPSIIVLQWEPSLVGSPADAYQLYLSTSMDNLYTSISVVIPVPDTFFSPYPEYDLGYGAQWYWQVVPFNAVGSVALSSCPIWSFNTMVPEFAGGNGTEADPYQIATATHLDNVRNHLDAHFIQISDIDLGVAPWNSGQGWVPISGATDYDFTGSYDGDNHIIDGLYISAPGSQFLGLFRSLQGSTVKNLKITNANVSGSAYLGMLAGRLGSSTILNVFAHGTVSGNNYTGGIGGDSGTSGVIRNSSSSGSIFGYDYVGGLVGHNASQVHQSFSNCSVDGHDFVGNLFGYNYSTTVYNCYSAGTVFGNQYVGGFAGGTELGMVTNCYSLSSVAGTANTGGMTGYMWFPTQFINSYWNIESSGQSTSVNGIGLTTLQMVSSLNFPGWDFENTWQIQQGVSYPYLQWQGTAADFNYPTLALPQHDLAIGTISGSSVLFAGYPSEFTVSVSNLGAQTQNSYTIKLFDGTDTELQSLNGTPIISGQSIVYTLNWTPVYEGGIVLYARVELAGDENLDNNQSPDFLATISFSYYMDDFFDFTQSTETYTPITGTPIPSIHVDDALSSAIPIGFPFIYGANTYTEVKISSNGWVGLGTSQTNHSPGNNLASTTVCPVLSPFWDDIGMQSGTVQYLLSGVSPNKVFTVQYENARWNYTASNQFNFQLRLWESGRIDFVYGPSSGTPGSPSASIGINMQPGGSGWFYSITPGSPASVSKTVENNTIATFPALGTVYSFIPTVERENNLAAFSVSGNHTPTVGVESLYCVRIRNLGSLPQSTYQVKLFNGEGTELSSIAGPLIQPRESADVYLPWTPSTAGIVSLFGRVVLPGDEAPANDQSLPLLVQVLPEGSYGYTIGDGSSRARIPVDMWWRNSLFETVFQNAELPFNGTITHLKFYNDFVSNLPNKPTKVWLGSTNLSDLSAGWIPSGELSLVFEGAINYPSGQNEILITLDTPYVYNEGNLVMMVNRPMDTVYYVSGDRFQSQEGGANRSRNFYSDSTLADPLNPPAGTLLATYPRTTFIYLPTFVPLPPQNFTLAYEAGDSWALLNWEAPVTDGVLGYKIYRNGVLIQNLEETSFTDVDLAHGQSYSYAVSAVYASEESVLTAAQELTVYLRPLPAVIISPANAATDIGQLPEFDWEAGSSSSNPLPDGYEFHLWTTDEPTVLSTVLNADQTHYQMLDALLSNTQYFWKITPYIYIPDRAQNTFGKSGLALHSQTEQNQRSVLYALDCPVWSFSTEATGQPVNLTAELDDWTNVVLNWELESRNGSAALPSRLTDAIATSEATNRALQHFEVYRNSTLLAQTYELHYYDSALADGYYEYYVVAVYSTMVSQPSNLAGVEVNTVLPPAYVNAEAEGDYAHLEIGHSAAGFETGYRIWRLNSGQETDEASWILLTEEFVGTDYYDSGWSGLPDGSYKWAVKAVYPDTLSEAVFSNELEIFTPLEPMIAVYPESIEHSMLANTTYQTEVTISNSGNATLDWNSSLVAIRGSQVDNVNPNSRPRISAELINERYEELHRKELEKRGHDWGGDLPIPTAFAERYQSSFAARGNQEIATPILPIPPMPTMEDAINPSRNLGLNLDPANGSVDPYSNLVCYLNINSSGSLSGTYEYELVITSNAVNQPELIVPITITVTGTPAYIPDDNFRMAINEALGQGTDYQPTIADLNGLYGTLYAHERNISSIEGAQHLTNLQELHLLDNLISDLSPVSGLVNLVSLNLWGNQISNIGPLSTLTNLNMLVLDFNLISDISPLNTLVNMQGLFLWNNQVSNLSPLHNMTNLQWLDLPNNQIQDISPLASLTNLREIYLNGNQITNLYPLNTLTSLNGLYIWDNNINDISPLANLTNLQYLYLDYNQISDLVPLANLTNLQELYLDNNPLSYESMLLSQSWSLPFVASTFNPTAPCYPFPARDQADISLSSVLSWSGNYNGDTSSFEVWAGFTPSALELNGSVAATADTLYGYSLPLTAYTNYYWRIKAIGSTETIWSGMWHFSTVGDVSGNVDRNLVVVEIGEGTWCQYCVGSAIGAQELLANDHPVAIINNHISDSFTNTYSNARNSYYNISGYPTAFFDGLNSSVGGSASVSMYSTYLPRVNSRIAIQSSYGISASGTFVDNILSLSALVAKPGPGTYNNVVLHCVITESNLDYNWFSQTQVHSVNRLMVPDQNGTPISLNTGQWTTIPLNIVIDNAWDLSNCEVVLFLQNTTSKEIIQGAKYPLTEFIEIPNPPSNVLAVDNGTSVNVSWNSPSGTTPQNYAVYRLLSGQETEETAWALLASSNADTSYEDTAWNEVSPGTYRWAVKAIYGSEFSLPAFSNVVEKLIPTEAIIAVTPESINHSLPANNSAQLELSIANSGSALLEWTSSLNTRAGTTGNQYPAPRVTVDMRPEGYKSEGNRGGDLPIPTAFAERYQSSFAARGNQEIATPISTPEDNPSRDLGIYLDPSAGNVDPYSNLVCYLNIDSSGSLSGTYEYELVITSNAVNQPQVTIPISIAVTGTPAYIPDDNFRMAINEHLGQAPDYLPTIADLNGIEGTLHASARGIENIQGAQYLINVTDLYMWGNLIIDISPLSGLSNIRTLYLIQNQISDLSPISTLSGLTSLFLNYNMITDISPLSSVNSLQDLLLDGNIIDSLAPVSFLTNLTRLSLEHTQTTDISALAALVNLTSLVLSHNQISDLSPLFGMQSLEYLYLNNNLISNINPLGSLTNLQDLSLNGNIISNFDPLGFMTRITTLGLGATGLSDLTPLGSLNGLASLNLNSNRISDITPLTGLINLMWIDLWGNPLSKESMLITQSWDKYFVTDVYNSISPCFPVPARNTVDILPNYNLQWHGNYNSETVSYEVYLGTDSGELQYIGNGVAVSDTLYTFSPGLSPLTLYYWRIKAIAGADSIWSGLWSFTTGEEIQEFAGGTGTEADPYQIASPEHLNNVRNHLSAYFQQIADIDLGTAPWNEGEGWEPIGNAGGSFTGYYDSGTHTISGLYINRPSQNYQGLFGQTLNATISNVKLMSVSVSAGNWAGALIGYADSTYIAECNSSGSINGQGGSIGGLIGRMDYSELQFSYSSAEVYGGGYSIGGLVGRTDYSSVYDSYSIGSVSGNGIIGGLIGYILANSSVYNSFSTGNVSGNNDYIGGFAGDVWNSLASNCYSRGSVSAAGRIYVGGFTGEADNSTLTNCYSTGNVIGGSESCGGFVGANTNASTFDACYWNLDTSGQSVSAGAEGRYTNEMTHPYAFNTYYAWDFASLWAGDIHYEINGGYPYLQWYASAPLYYPPRFVQAGLDLDSARIMWYSPLTGQADSYQVWRLIPGQESDEAVWTLVSGAVADTLVMDPQWQYLTEGTYKWAVKAWFGSELSMAEFSNELFKEVLNPYIDVTPASVYGNPVSGTTFMAELRIDNTGGSELIWSAVLDETFRSAQTSQSGRSTKISSTQSNSQQRDISTNFYPSSGSIAPYGFETIQLEFDTADTFAPQTFTYNLEISSNAANSALWTVPITIEVQLLIPTPNSAPVVSNFIASQRDDASMYMDIYYDVYDADGDTLNISMQVSEDGGTNWTVACSQILAGSDIGAGIVSGTGKHIIWDVATEHPNIIGDNFRFKIFADDGEGVPIPANFVFVEGGTFNNGTSDVTLSSFYIDKYELTQAGYQSIMGTNPSFFAGNPNHPVEQVSWYNAIEYCNRRSIIEGLTPCYSYSGYGTNPSDWPTGWNTSNDNHTNVVCNWAVNGYRLPTEAEWEFAARGGNQTQGYIYCGSNILNAVGWNISNSGGITHNVGELDPNELGVFDMSGNVWEWVWDILGDYPVGNQNDPHGPSDGIFHPNRGGCWDNSNTSCTYHHRNFSYPMDFFAIGIRLVRKEPYQHAVATPVFSPPEGVYTSAQIIYISTSTPGATIRYTLDGSEPSQSNGQEFLAPIYIPDNSSLVIKAIAYADGYSDSDIATASYTITGLVDAPVFNPPAGNYSTAQLVAISCFTPGAAIYYTTDGSVPTEMSNLYTDPILVSVDTTLKARAFLTNWLPSVVTVASYVIQSSMPANFVFVEGGTFNNGTSDVTLSSFYIDKYELTQADYQAVMGTNPATGYGVGSNYPVYYVSWFNAIEYCNRRSMLEGLTPCYGYSTYGTNPDYWPGGWNNSANQTNVSCNWTANGYRLPTEMEWMFAAKGGNLTNNYTYSGSNNINAVAWYSLNSGNTTHTVGTKVANEIGIFDMSGNMHEWCWDIYDIYPSGSQDNPTGANSGSYRVRRGGSWYDETFSCTVTSRHSNYPHTGAFYIGFRLCRISH